MTEKINAIVIRDWKFHPVADDGLCLIGRTANGETTTTPIRGVAVQQTGGQRHRLIRTESGSVYRLTGETALQFGALVGLRMRRPDEFAVLQKHGIL